MYDGYGGVEIEIESDDESTASSSSSVGKKDGSSDDKDTKKENKRSRRKSIMAYHQQFQEYFTAWGIEKKDDNKPEALFATKIYCAGEPSFAASPPKKKTKNQAVSSVQAMQRSRAAMLGLGPDPDEYEDRHCVPDLFQVRLALTEKDIATMPKTHEVCLKDTKQHSPYKP